MGQLNGRLGLHPPGLLNQQSASAQLLDNCGNIFPIQAFGFYLCHLCPGISALLLQSFDDIRCQRTLSRTALTCYHNISDQRIFPAFPPHSILLEQLCKLLIHTADRCKVGKKLLLLLRKLTGRKFRKLILQSLLQLFHHRRRLRLLFPLLFFFRFLWKLLHLCFFGNGSCRLRLLLLGDIKTFCFQDI